MLLLKTAHDCARESDAASVKRQLDELEIVITELVEYGGATFFFVRDPDGNVIEFHKPAT